MTSIKPGDSLWNIFSAALLDEFELRLKAMTAKGYMGDPARKTVAALFLQIKGFQVPGSDVLRKVTAIFKEKSVIDSRFENAAMMGHRIGVVDNISDIKQYLQDVYRILKPEGQMLITSLDVRRNNEPVNVPHSRSGQPAGLINMQFQQENLIGPFFSLLRIKSENLIIQVAGTNWQYEMIYRENDNNYLVRLTTSGSV